MVNSISLAPSIQKTVIQYADALRTRRIPFERIIVFGSHAKGTYSEKSDIDVCVVSRTFGSDYHQALVSLISASTDIDGNLDIVPYTPSDLADRYDPLAREIRRFGVEP